MAKRENESAPRSVRDEIESSLDSSYQDHSDLLYSMHELSRLISTHVDKHMAAIGVTHIQWWTLMQVYEREGMTQSELANVMQMGRAALGSLVERLEAKRWIERRPDSRDSRVRRVYLGSDVGHVFGHLADEGRALFKTFLAGISPAEEERLLAGIRKIRRNAEGS